MNLTQLVSRPVPWGRPSFCVVCPGLVRREEWQTTKNDRPPHGDAAGYGYFEGVTRLRSSIGGTIRWLPSTARIILLGVSLSCWKRTQPSAVF
jgi:hypothetical protein